MREKLLGLHSKGAPPQKNVMRGVEQSRAGTQRSSLDDKLQETHPEQCPAESMGCGPGRESAQDTPSQS